MRFLTAGESHGKALVGIIEGIPKGLKIDGGYINAELKRRQSGYGRGGRMKIESDSAEILSGVRGGFSTGAPIALIIYNKDFANWSDIIGADATDFESRKITAVRPGHADLSGAVKYGFDDVRDVLERASARETAMKVAIGAIAKLYLKELDMLVGSHVINIGGVNAKEGNYSVTEIILKSDSNDLRCMDISAYEAMKSRIDKAVKEGDTVGGVVEVAISGAAIGIGSHVQFDRRLEYALGAHLGAIHAVKSVEFGLGRGYAEKFGSMCHDEISINNGVMTRGSNNAGGIEGGMTNGEVIIARLTVKPIPTVIKGLKTIDLNGGNTVTEYERSDFCAVPAAGVVAEAAAAYVMAEQIDLTFGGDTMEEVKERFFKRKSFKLKKNS